jgi:hypothetical protein
MIGVSSPVLSVPNKYEYNHMILKDKKRSDVENIELWEDFYGQPFIKYLGNGTFIKVKGKNEYLDTKIYKSRMRYTLSLIFNQVQKIAEDNDTRRSILMIPILGSDDTFKIELEDPNFFLETFKEIIEDIKNKYDKIHKYKIYKLGDLKSGFVYTNENELYIIAYNVHCNATPGNEIFDGINIGSVESYLSKRTFISSLASNRNKAIYTIPNIIEHND